VFLRARAILRLVRGLSLIVNKLKVEEVIQDWEGELHLHLSEGLPNADAFTTMEWHEGKRIPRFTFRIDCPLVSW